METPELFPTQCAICGTFGNATELYPANFDWRALNPAVFSARRLPDRIHYRMVKCNTCALLRSDPIAKPELLAQLYKESKFTYKTEVADLTRTYGRYLASLKRYPAGRDALLEIGCGNGFFLEEALNQGYANVFGVEPSQDAVTRARPEIRKNIICDIMRKGLFEEEQFDVICMFQVLDHIADPASLLEECVRLLKPGGLLLILNHNIQAVSAKIMRERSPIIDIEHTYLYSPDTISLLLSNHKILIRNIASAYNTYPLQYLLSLVPFWAPAKKALLSFLGNTFIGRIQMSVPLGNMVVVAQRLGGTREDLN
jgi:SAM-dependent methyltransferase